jgi:GxxExxY protein
MLHEDITERIIRAAIQVHSALGAGLLESTYSACLFYQLTVDGLHFEHQVRLPVVYGGVTIAAAYRIDVLVEDCVIVELKAVEKLLPLHVAQLLTYLKLSKRPVGLLINFNVPHLRQGIRRVVNGYRQELEKDLPSVSPVSSVVESDVAKRRP